MKKVIFWLFAILLFAVPIVLWPFTSEVFEFNKMVLVYMLTALIVAAWMVRSITEGKIVFRRTILDKPLLIFLASQFISTILSIDPLTSWLGYYSRFNGGMLSDICYALLYWAFVSNFKKRDSVGLINYSLLPGAALVSLYGVAEHFGIDKNIWVQDVQSRVFSTLGQPNWLAAWLVALMPISWAFLLDSKVKSGNFWANLSLSILFFWTLIFTKSRSGLLGFAAMFITFWALYVWKNKSEIKKYLLHFGAIAISILIISLISGTELTPSLSVLFSKPMAPKIQQQSGDTALEVGGTESGTIRQIVWKGAVNIWAHYPVFGTGVETFAFSYYKFRPVEHNLTSEWDFIYNKAHNEFLNMAANSGTVGIAAYIFLIAMTGFLFIKALKTDDWKLIVALFSGYLSLSVTNFFGFSVVPTQLEFFLFPAFAIALEQEDKNTKEYKSEKISPAKKAAIVILLPFTFYLLLLITRYWLADTYYAKGTAYNSAQRPDTAIKYLRQAESFEPSQPLYLAGPHALSDSYAALALSAYRSKQATSSAEFMALAINYSKKAADLSPSNVTLKRVRFGLFITLAAINPNFLIQSKDVLLDALTYAPADPKLYYNLGLVYARTGETDKAIETFRKTIQLKSNYADPRLALSYLLIDRKDFTGAREQLNYILKNIDPTNSLAKQTLDGLP